ncbi:hypothetical protein JYQ62_23500 [Nostoc sp. UHCC 0702]|nr:hypothetical protein JYQ62_23500 [Nostoc sp. UHCC 0702]
MSDFAKAAQQVAPTVKRATKPPKSQTQLCQKVRICSQSHPNYGQEGVIESDPPNHWQQLLTLEDGSKILVNNNDLDAPSVPFPNERVLPPEYAEDAQRLGANTTIFQNL